MSLLSSTLVLGKRRRGQEDGLVLHLSSSSPENDITSESTSESDFESESEASKPLASTPTLVKVPKQKKQYTCTFEGCNKVYRKPCRLAEHQRSHTGDVCLSVNMCFCSIIITLFM